MTTAAAKVTTAAAPSTGGNYFLVVQVTNVTETFADVTMFAGDGPGSEYMVTLTKADEPTFAFTEVVTKQPFMTVIRLQPLDSGELVACGMSVVKHFWASAVNWLFRSEFSR